MALKKSDLYSSLWRLRRAARRHGRQPVQGLRPRSAVREVRLRQVRRTGRLRAARSFPEGGASPTWSRSRATRRSATRSTRIIGRSPRPTASPRSTSPTSTIPDKLGKGKEMVGPAHQPGRDLRNPALDFRSNRAEGDDLLGDAYEYLMRHFATESGKSKGQFYTPAEVCRVMASDRHRAAQRRSRTPSTTRPAAPARCCSRSPTRPGKHDHALRPGEGQRHGRARPDEHDPARLPDGRDLQGNTLAEPKFTDGEHAQDVRLRGRQSAVLGQGVEQRPRPREATRTSASRTACRRRKNGDYAFLLHILRSLKSTGKGACILPHGVLFRGNAEADIRRQLVQHGLSSRASSACPPTSSTAPASRPASSCSTRKTPLPARASS